MELIVDSDFHLPVQADIYPACQNCSRRDKTVRKRMDINQWSVIYCDGCAPILDQRLGYS